ncbi:spore coat associated protein JA (CotJA) [Natranaerovirga pectinivora]|uniref:Spore coat associated protein JA (CotJA) n=1 Tax=Natranaerovirga pectinivora TaxID=682400 RepID=A0A4R3MPT5_9FIRM|nr:spore coat associated protein CotJA [Natranaerovirga pectinivora]TCT16291.1 spore coat associated protein JA (CotJA) [Natranaerovirga pectinivora]
MRHYPTKCIEETCGKPIPDLPLAKAFVKVQPYVGLVPLKEGFKRGSIWPNLYEPYVPHPKKIRR